MRLYRDWGTDDLPQQCVAALGNFDGVHCGHQAILAAAKDLAQKHGKPCAAMVFYPHPRAVLVPDSPPFEITPLAVKIGLLAQYGVEILYLQRFTKKLAGLSGGKFIRDILCQKLAVSHVVTGQDFAFGQGRDSNTDTLGVAARNGAFGFTKIEHVGDQGTGRRFSSSRIRQVLGQGDVVSAMTMLGRPWMIRARVISGDGRGKNLGFPTMNVAMLKYPFLRFGVYVVAVRGPGIKGRLHYGVANFGQCPTFQGQTEARLEVHILDFDGDLYGQGIEVDFLSWLRGEKRFADVQALQTQVQADIATARTYLATLDRNTLGG